MYPPSLGSGHKVAEERDLKPSKMIYIDIMIISSTCQYIKYSRGLGRLVALLRHPSSRLFIYVAVHDKAT